ncbi:MAG TPA: Ger(x)C family spore germination protein [Bacillota bacterium]|mgnify:FL=1|nr:Ger(x)C family spore germination protein [Bacillota bacterium]
MSVTGMHARTQPSAAWAGQRQRRTVVVLVCLLVAASITGCRDAREIESVGFVLGLGIDETADGRIEVWAQVALPSAKPTEGEKQESWRVRSVGDTVWDAVRQLNGKSTKVLFRAHVRALVFGERFARGGVARALDALARDKQFRYKSWVFVTSDPVGDVLGTQTKQSSSAALFLDDIMRNTARSLTAPRSRFLDLLTSIEQPGDQPLLARVRLVEAEDVGGQPEGAAGGQEVGSKELRVEGSAALRGDRLVGWLDAEDTAMALMVCNRLEAYSFIMPMPGDEGGSIGFDMIRSRANTLFPEGIRTPRAAGQVTDVVIRVTGTVDIREVLSSEQLMSARSLERLEAGISRHLEAGVRRLIDFAQNRLGCDVLGIGECARHRLPAKVWEEDVAPTWHDQFRTMRIVPDIRFEVGKRGMTMQSPKPID